MSKRKLDVGQPSLGKWFKLQQTEAVDRDDQTSQSASPSTTATSVTSSDREISSQTQSVASDTDENTPSNSQPDDYVFDMISKADFESYKLHQFNICRKETCSSLSSQEKQNQCKSRDKFAHSRLCDKKIAYCEKTGIWWLLFQEQNGMFCLLCRKHDTCNTQNKSKIFNLKPSERYKLSAIIEHANSKMHKASIELELTSRVSVFHKEVIQKETVSDNVIYAAFCAVFWLMKEEISNSKLKSIIKLSEKMGLSSMKHYQYTGAGTEREMFLIVGDVIKQSILETVRKVGSFGLLFDEVTDIAVMQQMIAFIQFVDPITSEAKVFYLDVVNVLEASDSANSETLHKCILSILERNGLDVKKCSSLVTDGASVMTGKNSGVAARMKKDNPSLISLHCICHRLALSCVDTNKSIDYLCQVERILRNLWKFFEDSPKRTSVLTKVQLQLKKVDGKQLTKSNRINLTRKVKKACHTRWLSFNVSVQSLDSDFIAILQTLRLLKQDPTALGLLKKMDSVKFIGTIKILKHVLPKLSSLSQAFQQGTINLSGIGPAIDYTKDALDNIAANQEPILELQRDLGADGVFNSLEREPTENQIHQLRSCLSKYIIALKHNIDARFGTSIDVLEAFDVFNPLLIPERNSPSFKSYGTDKIKKLSDQFFNDTSGSQVATSSSDSDELVASWEHFKYELLKFKKCIPENVLHPSSLTNVTVTPTQWLLQQLMANKFSFCKFDKLLKLAEICLSMPVSNAWPERGASALKRIKTRLRSVMKNDMLGSLLQVTINGPELGDENFDKTVRNCCTVWKNVKQRKKLPRVAKEHQDGIAESDNVQNVVQEDVGVQVDIENEEINDKMKSVEKLAKLLGLDIFGDRDHSDHSDTDSEEDENDYDF